MKNCITTLVLLAGLTVVGQKMDLGKVTLAELEQKSFPKDTTAEAAILFKKGSTSFTYSFNEGFLMESVYEVKIKVYKKGGYDLANVIVPYYSDSNKGEKVSFSDAVTYNLEGGKIVKSKLKSEGQFDEKTNKFWSRKKIVMPNVKVGSIIEYSYKVTSPYFNNLPEWSFQQSVPVVFSEYRSAVPEYFKYNLHTKGQAMPKHEQSTRPIHMTGNALRELGAAEVQGLQKSEIKYLETVNKFTMQDIPALRDEGYVNNISNYTSGLVFELSSIEYPNQTVKLFSSDWESVVKKIYDDASFGDELKKASYYEADLASITATATTPEQKTAAIFDFVKKRMNWDGMYGFLCDKGVKRAYQDRTGNVAEINLMLTAMLRSAGLDARPILVSTRSNGVSLYPSRSSYNYVISGVESNGKITLLDATSKYSVPDLLPMRDLNWFGRIIREGGSSDLVDLMPKSSSKELYSIIAQVDAQGKTSGKYRRQSFDHNALLFRNDYVDLTQDSYLEKLENDLDGIEISEYKREGDADCGLPIVESCSFSKNAYSEVVGDKLYISPLMFLEMGKNPFTSDTRDYPIDFAFPRQKKYSISINLPEGYAVESMPKEMKLAMPDNVGSFRYVIQGNEKSVQLSINYEINSAIFPAEYYQILRDFFQKMIEKQNEKIVLKKV